MICCINIQLFYAFYKRKISENGVIYSGSDTEGFLCTLLHELTFTAADICVFIRDIFGIFTEKFAVPDAGLQIFTSEIQVDSIFTEDQFTFFILAPKISADNIICHGRQIRRQKFGTFVFRKDTVFPFALLPEKLNSISGRDNLKPVLPAKAE